jgi:hypothetical protein
VVIRGVWQYGQLVALSGRRPEAEARCLGGNALLVAVEAATGASTLKMSIPTASAGGAEAIGVAITNGGSSLCAEPFCSGCEHKK